MATESKSPVRRSETPEQAAKVRDSSANESPVSNAPAVKKQRSGEGDGPLNLSKPKGNN